MDLSGGILLDFGLENLDPLLEGLSKFLRRRVYRHLVHPERHLDVKVSSIDPHAIPKPRSGEARRGVAFSMQEDERLAGGRFHAQHEAFIFANSRGPLCQSDQEYAVRLRDAGLRPGRVDVGVY